MVVLRMSNSRSWQIRRDQQEPTSSEIGDPLLPLHIILIIPCTEMWELCNFTQPIIWFTNYPWCHSAGLLFSPVKQLQIMQTKWSTKLDNFSFFCSTMTLVLVGILLKLSQCYFFGNVLKIKFSKSDKGNHLNAIRLQIYIVMCSSQNSR